MADVHVIAGGAYLLFEVNRDAHDWWLDYINDMPPKLDSSTILVQPDEAGRIIEALLAAGFEVT